MCERVPEQYVWRLRLTRGDKAPRETTYPTPECAKAVAAKWVFMEPQDVPWVDDETHTRITAEVGHIKIVIERFPIQGIELPAQRLRRRR